MHARPDLQVDALNEAFPKLAFHARDLDAFTRIPSITSDLITAARVAFDEGQETAVRAGAARQALAALGELGEIPDAVDRVAVENLALQLHTALTKVDYTLLQHIPCIEVTSAKACSVAAEVLFTAIARKDAESLRPHEHERIVPVVDLVVQLLADADQKEHWTHGLTRVLRYVEAIRGGSIDPHGELKIVEERGGFLRCDGGGNFGQWAVWQASNSPCSVPKKRGSCSRASRWATCTTPAGCSTTYARQHCRGLSCMRRFSWEAPGESRSPGRWETTHGTNPFAIGVPAGDGKPIVVDFASSAETEGTMRLASLFGLSVSPGLLKTCTGRPTPDPNVIYNADRGSVEVSTHSPGTKALPWHRRYRW